MPRYTESELDTILPKKKFLTGYDSYGKGEYNKAIDDCRATLLKGVLGGTSEPIKQKEDTYRVINYGRTFSFKIIGDSQEQVDVLKENRMAKKETVISILKEIRDNTKPVVLNKEIVKVPSTRQDFIFLRISPYRFRQLEDGWFRDEYLSAYYGKNYDWAPASLEKNISYNSADAGSLPGRFDLESLRDLSKCNPAIVDAAKILGLKTDDYYWTKEEVAGNSSCAWIVGFDGGNVYYYDKDYTGYVRPVRSS